MKWQQLLVALWLMWMFVFTAMKVAKDRSESSDVTAWTIVLSAAELIGVALVLSSGGFW